MQTVPHGLPQREEDQREHGQDNRRDEQYAQNRVAVSSGAAFGFGRCESDRRHSVMAFCVASAMFCIAWSTVT